MDDGTVGPDPVRALRRSLASTPLRQPDALSCGACVAEVATALVTRVPPPPPTAFDSAVLARHRRLTSVRDACGQLQLPWPRWWGTPPWALARHLSHLTARPHHVVWGRTSPRRAADAVRDALASGTPVALYVGSTTLPRHVLLAVAATEGTVGTEERWTVYDPATGRLRELPVGQWLRGRLDVGWPRPWCAVVPRPVSRARR